MRIVLDTNVVASALLCGGTPSELLRAARGGKVTLATSTPMLVELADPRSRRKFTSRIAAQRYSIEELLARYVHLNLVVRPVPVAGVAPDPVDDVVVGTALAARADFIVSGDKGPLGVQRHRDVEILRVAEAVLRIDG